jgi:hypothetical protein
MMHWISLVAALGLLVLGCKDDKAGAAKNEADNGGKQVSATQMLTKKLAYEAYPTWSAKNPEKACPDKIDDLIAAIDELYADSKAGKTSSKDAWGTELKMLCGPTLPADARGLAIQSAGPDARFDTADDIKSWPM